MQVSFAIHGVGVGVLHSWNIKTYILGFIFITGVAKVRPSKYFFAGPVSNFGCTTKLFMNHFSWNYPKLKSIMWSLCKKEGKKNLRPAIQYLNEIWPVRKKAGYPWFIKSLPVFTVFHQRFIGPRITRATCNVTLSEVIQQHCRIGINLVSVQGPML